jgi:Na+-transporting NADH:ubiquinone oxidoreductase subunit NqrB
MRVTASAGTGGRFIAAAAATWSSQRREARNWQILALASLLAFNLSRLDYGASVVPSAVAITVCLAVQAVWSKTQALPLDLRSPLITGLSLSLLLRGDALWVMAAGAAAAIASKFILRFRGSHVWNPAAFGIVAMLATGHAWVSPGQWGGSILLVLFFGLLAISVLVHAGRVLTALFFLAAYASLLALRAYRLGDPWTIPAHQLESGALLLFAFFMVTDPRTTPKRFSAQAIFVFAVAILAHYLAFTWQCRPALYWALFALAPATPLLNLLFSSRPRAPAARRGAPEPA